MRTHSFIFAGLVMMLSCAGVRGARAANDAPAGTGPMQKVVAGERYGAGGFHRFLLGDDYRKLWTTPVEVPLLDLHSFAGGLEPVKRVGGQQTLGLAMKGADGRDYTFRGLDKDPSDILPPEYQGTIVNRLLQDQIASSLPGGALVVSPIMDAAGVLHSDPILVVLPDDSLLGEFRETFAGVVGTFEVYPRPVGDGNPGFANATEIINGATMWEHMDADPGTRPDARAFLKARLVDLLVGDWDRHRGQWRWAKIPGSELWQPIPEDRDQAFVRFEGLIPAAGRQRLPQFVSFGDDYPGIEGLTWNGRDGDRRILVSLEKPVWDQTAAELKARITDDVIAEAVARLPRAYQDIDGAELEHALRKRRDALPEIAGEFYRFLARDVDVHLTAQNEHVTVDRADNGDVTVTAGIAAPDATPWYRRTFRKNETDEVRIYLGGGDDTVVTSGGAGNITVRVIGGGGVEHIDDSAGTGLRVSDAGGNIDLKRGKGTTLDTRRYSAPPRATAPWIPPRDWGHTSYFFPWIGGNSDLGVLFLGTYQIDTFGFRKDPFAARHTFRLGYGTRAGAFGGDYHGEFHHENTRRMSDLYVRISGLDVLHYYGFGNETSDSQDDSFYKVKHTQYVFRPSAIFPFGASGTASAGLQLKYGKTNLDEDNYIATAPPYGSDDFLQVGAVAGVELDSRDVSTNATRGHHVVASGAVYPPAGQVESTFGEVHGEAALYLTAPVVLTPTLALRAGGAKVWGPYPWHEAAYIGGVSSLRGFASQRFAGDASAYGSAELRIPLTRIFVFVPGTMGIFGLGDVGRVFLAGETSNEWHTDAGGGLWFWFVQPENTISLFAAASDEGTRFYLRAGLGF